MKRTILIACIGIGLSLVSVGLAGSLDQICTSDTARWVLHIDGQQFWKSQLGGKIRSVVDQDDMRKLASLKELFGSDPLEDLHRITLYGPDANDKRAVAVVRGRFDRKKLLALVALNPAYEELDYKNHPVYRWIDEDDDKTQFGAFAAEDVLIISQSRAALEAGLDVLQIRSSKPRRFSALKDAPEGAFVAICAEDLAELTKDRADASMTQNSRSLVFTAGETDGTLWATLQLEANTSEAAQQIVQMAQGMIAFAGLQQDKFPQIMPLIQACKLSAKNKTATLSIQYPSLALFAMVEELIPEKVLQELK
jgi:hypothetical protein